MNIGFARAISRLPLDQQLASLNHVGCHRIWDSGRLTDCIGSLGRGETLVVHSLPVLAVPKPGRPNKRARPRDDLRRIMDLLAAKGVPVLEASTGRRSVPDEALVNMVLDAVDHWSGRSGNRSTGRPPVHIYGDEDRAIIRGLWSDKKHKNNAQRVKAVREFEGPDGKPRFPRFTAAVWYEQFKPKERSDG